MKVPLLDLAAQFKSVEADLRKAVDGVLSSQIYILGPEVEAFEAEMADFTRVKHAVGVSNGSDAIVTALLGLGIGTGDEVIVPAFTFFGSAGSVARTGATPIFVDVLPDTFNIDPAAAENALTPKTRAILPVHLYGQCADMTRLVAIADKHGLAVVEDGAQAIGATFDDRPIGNLGSAATLSFYPTKNLSAIGEGGMVLTNDGALADKIRMIRNHGQGKQYEHDYLGGNYRLQALQGAALRVKLPHLSAWNEARRSHAARYDEGLAGSTVITPPVDPRCQHVYHQYTIRSPRRDDLRAHLNQAGIASGIYYPLGLHQQPCLKDLGHAAGLLQVTEQACKEVLSLPVFPEMTRAQQDYVIETIRKFK